MLATHYGTGESAAKVTPDDILDGHSPEVRALTDQLRTLIKETLPEVREIAYPGWRGIGYHDLRAGYICAIFPQKNDVRLGFERGVRLPDPNGLLEGEGRQVRYVNIADSDGIQTAGLQQLLKAAAFQS